MSKTPKRKPLKVVDDGTVRLQKVLADRGLCSRRKAEELIAQGKVRVNGQTATLGLKIDPVHDTISVTGLAVPKAQPAALSLIMNKPKGVICSHGDPHHSKTIYDLLPKPYAKTRLFCAGRLDKDSEGLLILSNDGKLVHALTHPSSGIVKRYSVQLNKPLDVAKIPLFIKGVYDEGEHLFAHAVVPTQFPGKDCTVEIHMQQGRKREVRRLCAALGYYVERLKRFQVGRLVLRKLPVGAVRLLTVKEREQLLTPHADY